MTRKHCLTQRKFSVMTLQKVSLPVLAAALLTAAAPTPKAQLMVLGTVHFDNPGRDIANVKVENVLTPQRQQEIAAVVDDLAKFRPNHVAIEWATTEQAALDKRYDAYRAGRYVLSADERDQIGLRLAAKLGLAHVDASDWNEEPPGKDEDYDFPGWLKAHGRAAEWSVFQAEGQRDADAAAANNRCHPISDWLRNVNAPPSLAQLEAPYFRIATFGDADRNPGAAWVGAWHARNLRIYANLVRAAGKPGDRTIAIFGAGHASLLQSYAAQSGSFDVVSPLSVLPWIHRARC